MWYSPKEVENIRSWSTEKVISILEDNLSNESCHEATMDMLIARFPAFTRCHADVCAMNIFISAYHRVKENTMTASDFYYMIDAMADLFESTIEYCKTKAKIVI